MSLSILDKKGHGALGLRSNLRDYRDLIDEDASRKTTYIQLRPTQEIEEWVLDDSNTYVAAVATKFGGIYRDIVSVQSRVDPKLTRVESVALCKSTPGSYYYDVDEEFAHPSFVWDDPATVWSSCAVTFDGSNHCKLSSELRGIADGYEGTFVTYLRRSEAPSADEILLCSGDEYFCVYLDSSGRLNVIALDSAGATIFHIRTSANICDGDWHNIFTSFDCDTSLTSDIYIDGASDKSVVTSSLGNQIDYTRGEWAVGYNANDGSDDLSADVGEISFDDARLDPASYLSAFYDSGYVDMGVYGQKPTGSRPLVFFQMKGDRYHENYGSAQNFDDVLDSPSDVEDESPAASTIKFWDQFRQVYVHLSDNSNPNDTDVIVAYGFYFAPSAEVHPTLGEDKLGDIGFFESWSGTPELPSGFTEGNRSNGGPATKSTEVPGTDDYSLSFVYDGDEAQNWNLLYSANKSFIVGKYYRVSGYYRIDSEERKGIAAFRLLWNDGSDKSVASDGRTIDTSAGQVTLEETPSGEWRRFVYDFVAPVATMRLDIIGGVDTATDVATIYFDEIEIRPIYRYELYEPRISSSSIPSVSVGSNDVFFGGKQTGIGSVSLNNADAYFEKIAGQLEWINQEVLVRSGGRFSDDLGQEILFDDTRAHLTGLVEDIDLDDEEFALSLRDIRSIFNISLPPESLEDTETPNMDLSYQGRSKPMWFGAKSNVTPIRIDYESTYDKYGVYLLADCALAPNGIKEVTSVYAYLESSYAEEKNTTKRIELTETDHYTVDLANGKITVVADVGPYEITTENQLINFDIGGSELTAEITVGLYTAANLAAEIQTQMRAEGAADEVCTYSEADNTFTISKPSGTLNLLIKTGANKDVSPWSLLGFDRKDDKTGSLSYESDNVVFEDPDKEHVLRVDGQGYKDDGSGTYTGSASALIEIGADIARVLFARYLKRPAADIDEESFVFARTRSPESLSIYLKEKTELRKIFDNLEFSNVANIIIDGEGKIYYLVYVGEVAENAPHLYDRDFVKFKAGRSGSDVYKTIKVLHDKDPSTEAYEAREATDASVELRFGAPETRTFETYIKLGTNAQTAANRLLELAKKPARNINLTTRSALIDRKVGDKIRITRKRALDKSGALKGAAFRIISIRKSPQEGEISVRVVDDVVTVASIACVSSCQVICEQQCEGCGQTICQTDCQVSSCQVGCEVGCQGCGQAVCQDACELSCQGCGQTTCQDTCETVSQGCGVGCEVSCQGCGQTTCQDTCEVTCQGCGQTTCQTVCQLGCEGCGQTTCQDACELSCQGCGQTSCQDACEGGVCQTACQTTTCQDACETSCETVKEQNPDI